MHCNCVQGLATRVRLMANKPGSVQPERASGQESVWDYPRPPACEPSSDRIMVFLDGDVIADTKAAYRMLETSHPPVYYIPAEDVVMSKLQENGNKSTFCEWKGSATYYDSRSGEKSIAWAYMQPVQKYEAIKGYLAFYPSKIDKATVDGEVVRAQEVLNKQDAEFSGVLVTLGVPIAGDFYGGWITDKIVGPFKGGAGTLGW